MAGHDARGKEEEEEEGGTEESRAEPLARPARTRQLVFSRATVDGREEAGLRESSAGGHQQEAVASLSGRSHNGAARTAQRHHRRHRPCRGKRASGRERRKRRRIGKQKNLEAKSRARVYIWWASFGAEAARHRHKQK